MASPSSWFDASAAEAVAQYALGALWGCVHSQAGRSVFEVERRGPGYALSCLAVASGALFAGESPDASAPVRVLAAICLKNCIHRHWRVRRRGAAVATAGTRAGAQNGASAGGVSHAEKEILRARILDCLAEPNDAVAAQLAVIIGKIARLDWPQEYPGLIEALVKCIESTDVLVERRGTAAMYAVLKELSSRRLLADRRQMEQLAKQLLGGMYSVWKLKARFAIECLQRAPSDAAASDAAVELLYKTSKVLRLLFVHGSPNLDAQDAFGGVFGELFDLIEFFIRTGATSTGNAISKCIKCLVKIIVDTQKGRSVPFLPYLSLSLEKFYVYLRGFSHARSHSSTTAGDSLGARMHSDEKLAILSMHFFANVLQCKAYKQTDAKKMMTSRGDVSVTARAANAARAAVQTYFSEARVTSLLEVLLARCFPLNEGDMETWTDDPEEFVVLAESCTSEEKARAAAEHLFVVLVTHQHGGAALRSLVAAISNHEAQHAVAPSAGSTIPMASVLQRDALYLAAGLAAFQLEGTINFSEWFVAKLVPLMRSSSEVLQRRILWLIGCFVAQLSADLRPSVYESVFQIMADRPRNLVVRLAASTTAKALLDDWDFDADAFAPYLVAAVSAAYALLRDVSVSEMQLQIFALLEQIVNRAGARLAEAGTSQGSAIECILRPLPWLWEQCSHADHSLLRGAIVRMLNRIVSSSGVVDDVLGSVVLPILSYATDLSQDDNVYLLTDAVELWETIASHVPVHTPQLHSLLPRIAGVVKHDMGTLRACIQILEDSFLLGSRAILSDKAVCASIADALDAVVGHVRPRGSVGVVRCLETMLRCDHIRTALVLAPTVERMMRLCFGERPRSNGDIIDDDVPCDLVLVGYLTIIARVGLLAKSTFATCLERAASEGRWHGRAGDLFSAIVKLMVDKFDAVDSSSAGPWRRKTWSLFLCASLTLGGTPLPGVLNLAPEIFGVCSSVARELSEEEEHVAAGDRRRESVRSYASGDERRGSLEDVPTCFSGDEGDGVGVAARRRAVFASDPVIHTDILHACKEQFGTVKNALSAELLNAVASCVDPGFAAILSQA